MEKSANSRIEESYGKLYSDPRAEGKFEFLPLESFRKASAKKGETSVKIILCDEDISDFTEVIGKRNISAAFVISGAGLSDDFVAATKKQKSISVIGLQKYLFDPQFAINLNNAGAETLRLGEIRDDITLCEPLLREAEYIFIDMTSVKSADFPLDTEEGNPNGFSSDEICGIARYAGFSCALKAVFICGIKKDMPGVCNNLAAQVVWHVINGLVSNLTERPEDISKKGKTSGNFEHKIVPIDGSDDAITFLKSRTTGRLWIEIPVVKKEKNIFIPCSEADYQATCRGEIPARWVFYYNKYNVL